LENNNHLKERTCCEDERDLALLREKEQVLVEALVDIDVYILYEDQFLLLLLVAGLPAQTLCLKIYPLALRVLGQLFQEIRVDGRSMVDLLYLQVRKSELAYFEL